MTEAKRLPAATPLAQAEPSHPDARTDLEGWAAYAKEKIDGRPVIVSVSGGKDSLAVGLLLKSAGIPFSCVHFSTGWESEITDEYVRDYLPTILGPITVLQSEHGGMEELCIKKGLFPSRIRRWCTDLLKIKPFMKHLSALDDEPVSVVGVRSGESKARSELPEWEENKRLDCDVWRPIIDWSYQDVIDMHKKHGAKPNPLYLMGATRVGCWPCIFSRKSEIRLIADIDPARIDRVERLEAAVKAAATERYAKSGTVITSAPPGFFQATSRNREGVRPCIPIRKAVEWSRTVRGGKQFDLFAPDHGREGCMRWGMCDVPAEEDA